MSSIFISYRRDDTAGEAGRLQDRLVSKFGRPRVFMDVYAMEPGLDFVEVIEEHIGKCSVLLVLIGRAWLTSDSEGNRRINDAGDFHRLEIEAALKRGIRVIPVLIQGATMPREEDLPDDLKRFARRHALEISATRWDYDVSCLFEVVERILKRDGETVAQPKKIPDVNLESAVLEAALHAIDTVGVEKLRQQQEEMTAETREDAVAVPPPTTKILPVEAVQSEAITQHDEPSKQREETESSSGVGWKVAAGLAVIGFGLAAALWPGIGLLVTEPTTSLTPPREVAQRTAGQAPPAATAALFDATSVTPATPVASPAEPAPADAALADVETDELADPSVNAPDPIAEIPEPAPSVDTPPAAPVITDPPDPSSTPEQTPGRAEATTPAAPPPPRDPVQSGLRGTFRDSSGGVAGVTVRLVGDSAVGALETTTSDDGVYEFFPVPPGEYTVLFIRDQKTVHERPAVSIGEGQFLTLRVDLMPVERPP